MQPRRASAWARRTGRATRARSPDESLRARRCPVRPTAPAAHRSRCRTDRGRAQHRARRLSRGSRCWRAATGRPQPRSRLAPARRSMRRCRARPRCGRGFAPRRSEARHRRCGSPPRRPTGSTRMICPSWTVKVPSPLSAPISAIGLRPVPCRSRSIVARPASAPSPGRRSARLAPANRTCVSRLSPSSPRSKRHRAGHAPARDRAVDLFERE